jgi:dolichol-phosphate mannosyltransferase
MKTCIIIPTYNERENISEIIPKIFSFVPEIHVLVVDDNSPDKTFDVVKDLQKKYPNLSLLHREKKAGLGKAYLNAFQNILNENRFDAIITMDADFSHDPKYLPIMLKAAETNDVVVGSRYIQGGGLIGWSMWRTSLSKFANFYVKHILNLPISDYTAGFILTKTKVLKKINLDKINSAGYSFLVELKTLLWKEGKSMKEIPIVLHDRTAGKSKMSKKVIWEAIWMPWKIRKKL